MKRRYKKNAYKVTRVIGKFIRNKTKKESFGIKGKIASRFI